MSQSLCGNFDSYWKILFALHCIHFGCQMMVEKKKKKKKYKYMINRNVIITLLLATLDNANTHL